MVVVVMVTAAAAAAVKVNSKRLVRYFTVTFTVYTPHGLFVFLFFLVYLATRAYCA